MDFTLEAFYIELSSQGIQERHHLFYEHKISWKYVYGKAAVNGCSVGSYSEWCPLSNIQLTLYFKITTRRSAFEPPPPPPPKKNIGLGICGKN